MGARPKSTRKRRDSYARCKKALKNSWTRIYSKDRKARFPQLVKAQKRKSYFKNRDKKLAWHKEHYRQQRIDFLMELGGGKCGVCGYSDWRALQVDHVNGDGAIDRLNNRYTTSTKKKEMILANRSRYQVLCSNCNQIKRYENRETRQKGAIPVL